MMISTSTRLASILLSLLLGLLLGLGAPTLQAAQAAQAGDTNDAGDAETAETATSEATTDTPASEVFIPTEEISEDFAVSFPVDI